LTALAKLKPLFMKKIVHKACLFLALFGVFAVAQGGQASAPFNPPAESAMPSGPQGDAIKKGKGLIANTRAELPNNVGNGLNCTNCHLNNGATPYAAPFVGLWGVFPEYRSRNAKVITLADRINDCFERSMNGKPLGYASNEMVAILAYMQWLSTGVPTGQSVEGRGFVKINANLNPNADNGKVLYAEKCASCHGAAGAGLKNPSGGYIFPPLWGKESFNDGAGMARTYTAAAFVRHNMPLGQTESLSDQEAIDISEYFTHQARPVYLKKSQDWLSGGKPKDARN
jgi:thiosulfate dehydrogenase